MNIKIDQPNNQDFNKLAFMSLSSLPHELLTLIFEQLNFHDKVIFTSISEFSFLRSTGLKHWFTEYPVLLLYTWFSDSTNYHKYCKIRLNCIQKIIEAQNCVRRLNRKNKEFSLSNSEFNIWSKYSRSPNDAITNYLCYNYTIYIELSSGKTFTYRYFTNPLNLIEVRMIENGKTTHIMSPKNSSILDIHLLNDFSLGHSRNLYRLSSLSLPFWNESHEARLTSKEELIFYDKISGNWNSQIVEINHKDNILRVKSQIRHPIIYQEVVEFYPLNLPCLNFSQEEMCTIKDLCVTYPGYAKNYTPLDNKDISFTIMWKGNYLHIYTFYKGYAHGPIFIDCEGKLSEIGHYHEGKKDGWWIMLPSTNRAYFRNGIIVKSLEFSGKMLIIDEQWYDFLPGSDRDGSSGTLHQRKIKNYELLRYESSLDHTLHPRIEGDFIITYELTDYKQ